MKTEQELISKVSENCSWVGSAFVIRSETWILGGLLWEFVWGLVRKKGLWLAKLPFVKKGIEIEQAKLPFVEKGIEIQ
jgi:hypothetical protein